MPFALRFPRRKAAILALLFVLASLSAHAQESPAAQTHGVVVANMDRSIKPGDNFWLYANGDWIKRTEIPSDRSYVGIWDTLSNLSRKNTEALIEEAAKANAPAGSNARKIADLYNSFMDESTIESRGLAPLRPHLDAIAAILDKHELAHALGESLRADVDALNNTNFHTPNLFGLWVAPGFSDSDHYAAYLMQGGIELPDREYYISNSDTMREVRAKYQAHVSAMLRLAGFTDTDARAQHVLELEHAIAEKHISLAENDDIHKADNPWKLSDFSAKAPGLDWTEFFHAAGLEQPIHYHRVAAHRIHRRIRAGRLDSLETWKDWLAFHLIEDYAGVLPKAFADERFAFYGKTLSGTPEQRPRWQRGVGLTSELLGDAVGQLYAQRYFPPEAKAQVQSLVANLITAFRHRIAALTWMDPATKAEAQAKLTTLYVGIGYPESWLDYSAYEVKPDDLFGNVWRSSQFDLHRLIARLGRPVDRKEWCMYPQTVNAVNLPLQNALNFPAAILQPPFFDPLAPPEVNYGAIGSVIGHEISHTFDTEGSTFDSKGALRNWWKAADLAHFNAATAKLAAQYDTYKPFPDLAVNGQQTLAENIADVAGISAAYDAYRAALAGKSAPAENGFSPDQQFFLAFAGNWRQKARDAALRQQVMTDGHSPDEYRASTVRNIDAWYAAFNIQPGEKLYLAPPDRVRIW